MNGPQHYREAEHLLAHANQPFDRDAAPGWRYEDLIGEAQLHATLALVAATVATTDDGSDVYGWHEVIA